MGGSGRRRAATAVRCPRRHRQRRCGGLRRRLWPLSSAMTLSGWIKPSVTQSGWRTIVQRQTDSYFLNASHDAGSLRGPAGRWDQLVRRRSNGEPVGGWTHVALTYDGTMLRLYVNGARSPRRTRLGSAHRVLESAVDRWQQPLRRVLRRVDRRRAHLQPCVDAGRDPDGPRDSLGLLAERRHDAADGADQPRRERGSPTQVNLTWTAATDNVAVTGYRVERCQGAGCSTFTQVGTPTTNSFTDTGLTRARRYRTACVPSTPRATSVAFELDRERDDTGGDRHDAADGADNLAANAVERHPGQPLLDGRNRQRRRDRIPGRALPGRRLLELRAGRDTNPGRRSTTRG